MKEKRTVFWKPKGRECLLKEGSASLRLPLVTGVKGKLVQKTRLPKVNGRTKRQGVGIFFKRNFALES